MASRGAADWQSMFVSLPREMNYELPRSSITGTLPADLQGCFTRNGPALFDRGGNTRVHSVDGDGMIVRVVFKDGRLFFANRFVRTKGVRLLLVAHTQSCKCTAVHVSITLHAITAMRAVTHV